MDEPVTNEDVRVHLIHHSLNLPRKYITEYTASITLPKETRVATPEFGLDAIRGVATT